MSALPAVWAGSICAAFIFVALALAVTSCGLSFGWRYDGAAGRIAKAFLGMGAICAVVSLVCLGVGALL